jgi:para-aminobenzoate synthetase component 1
MNYCVEFFAEGILDAPVSTYEKLNELSPMPFSCFYKSGNQYMISASPERFIAKRGNKIISQPIKGTAPRGKTEQEDQIIIEKLRNDEKEKSENVMIVDLVRNDLSRTAKRNSVHVEELFGIYTFRRLHQMISTVVSEMRDDVHWTDVIRSAFPMGSMTGAPKIRAMELIEEFENTKRGLYSGAVGYVTPEGDFDFNVVIRSILYNEMNKYISFMVGSAITISSDPAKEYEECMLKAEAMMKVLQSSILEKTSQ